jgi:septation ring formation regulator EzrA
MPSNQPYRWVLIEKVTKVSPNLGKIERNEAEIKWKDIKSKGRDLIKVLEKDLAANGKVILEHFKATWRCIQRLNRIALRGPR